MGVNEVIQIGSRIKKLRKEKGYTQKEFAKLVNIPYSTYSNYENNNREPSKAQIRKIADGLGVPLSSLIGWESAFVEYVAGDLIDDLTEQMTLSLKNEKINIDTSKLTKKIFSDKYTEELTTDIFGKMFEQFLKLNEEGQKEAMKRVQELTELSKYQKEETE